MPNDQNNKPSDAKFLREELENLSPVGDDFDDLRAKIRDRLMGEFFKKTYTPEAKTFAQTFCQSRRYEFDEKKFGTPDPSLKADLLQEIDQILQYFPNPNDNVVNMEIRMLYRAYELGYYKPGTSNFAKGKRILGLEFI